MAVEPLLVTRTVAVKPVFHSLLRMYWHLPPPTALLLDELTELELLVFTELLVEVATLVEVAVEVATEDELLVLTLDEVEVATDEVATEEVVAALEVLGATELVLLELAVPTMP